MSVTTISEDPSDIVYTIISSALPKDVQVGYDKPHDSNDTVVFLTLDAASMVTSVSQRWTLTVSTYASQSSGRFDYLAAMRASRRIIGSLLAHHVDYPLCDVQVQAGPIRAHDTDLNVDYLYTTFALDVACTSIS